MYNWKAQCGESISKIQNKFFFHTYLALFYCVIIFGNLMIYGTLEYNVFIIC